MEPQNAIAISLIIPVYKVSAYVERCLKSVMKQTYNHFECILVDDASPDDSIAKCEQMIASYDGSIIFRILHHEQNRGLSAARNTGIDAATGDYILFMDSDDIISNDCVEKLLAPIQKDRSIEMVFGGWMKFSDNSPLSLQYNFKNKKEIFYSNKDIRSFFFDGDGRFINAAWNKLVSKSFLTRYNIKFEEGQLFEDALWTFWILKHLHTLCSIPDVTYFYFTRADSITNGTGEEDRFKHKNYISSVISANLTPGDEVREADYHVKGFLNHYIRQPKTSDLQTTALRFAKALPFRKHPRQKTLLWAAVLLPHNHTGKEILNFIAKRLSRRQK